MVSDVKRRQVQQVIHAASIQEFSEASYSLKTINAQEKQTNF